jgi:hypothetical protein
MRGTHFLKSTDGQTSQNTERHLSKQGALTSWRVWINRQVRTYKESKQARDTYFLKSIDEQTSQDIERVLASKGHSLPEGYRQTDKLEHIKN